MNLLRILFFILILTACGKEPAKATSFSEYAITSTALFDSESVQEDSPGSCKPIRNVGLPVQKNMSNTHLLYLGHHYNADGNVRDQVWAVAINDGTRKLILDFRGSSLGLAFLKDGYHFILIGSSSVWLSDLSGVLPEEFQSAEKFIDDFSPYSPVWNALAFVNDSPERYDSRNGIFHSIDERTMAIWQPGDPSLIIKDKVTGDEIEVIKTPKRFDTIFGNWSPNGKQFAFSIYFSDTNESQIYIVNSDGQDIEPLTKKYTKTGLGWPHWSPDGKKLAYIRDAYPNSFMEILNIETKKIASTGIYPYSGVSTMEQGELIWSPDSNWIAFIIQEPVKTKKHLRYDIHTMNINTGEIYCFTQDESITEIAMDWR